jgi:hypothetical protein
LAKTASLFTAMPKAEKLARAFILRDGFSGPKLAISLIFEHRLIRSLSLSRRSAFWLLTILKSLNRNLKFSVSMEEGLSAITVFN